MVVKKESPFHCVLKSALKRDRNKHYRKRKTNLRKRYFVATNTKEIPYDLHDHLLMIGK